MDTNSRGRAGRAVTGDEPFDAHYYRHCCGRPYLRNDEWLAFFGGLADWMIREMAPRTVLDAGCGLGLLVECLRARGVEAFGVDVSAYAINNVHHSVRAFCWQGSAADELSATYDLIVSIEVLEHMAQPEAEAAIANFCRHTGDVLFSSSPGDYREATHVNTQTTDYWAEQFARHDYFRDVDFDASFLASWAVRFRKGNDPLHRVIRRYERRYAKLLLERNELRDSAIQLERARKDLEAVRTELAQAQDRIVHMERSIFWKLRRIWARISGQSQ